VQNGSPFLLYAKYIVGGLVLISMEGYGTESYSIFEIEQIG
jgi:hypothetical protein